MHGYGDPVEQLGDERNKRRAQNVERMTVSVMDMTRPSRSTDRNKTGGIPDLRTTYEMWGFVAEG